jgi:hypothetical protein
VIETSILELHTLEYSSHSNSRVDGVTILTISLLTIHFNFGSDTCSAIATLYQAATN